MRRISFLVAAFLISAGHLPVRGQANPDFKWNVLPIKALLLSAPDPRDVTMFCKFIEDALPREGVNTLVVRIRYRYQFKSHPELADYNALSEDDLKSIAASCKKAGVRLIPKMNLMAHQSEQTKILPLLAKYPKFDESPDKNPPVPWKDGGMFDFYTKSLCPRHPDLPDIIFPLMDELIDVCGADAFHVGLDEVWIIGDEKCPRCGGRDKAELFADYVRLLHDHLKEKRCEMWMWSDRLIDGKTTNLLAWQASMNNTYRAIDMIPKDIMICDWKYEDAPPTPVYFAIKGFNVLACPAKKADVALAHLENVYTARKNAQRADFSLTLSARMQGVFETSWMSAGNFIRAYYGKDIEGATQNAETFKSLFAEIRKWEASTAP